MNDREFVNRLASMATNSFRSVRWLADLRSLVAAAPEMRDAQRQLVLSYVIRVLDDLGEEVE